MIKEHITQVLENKIDLDSFLEDVLSDYEKINEEYNCFSVISKDLAIECKNNLVELLKNNKKPKLAGVIVSLKDCICAKEVETTATSKILKGYKPIFNATVVEKLKNEGAIIVGKTIQDEFGFGSFCTNTGINYPTPKNPHDKTRCVGGSSGGSAAITALSKHPHISIAESTGGSIENPASFCGVIGFCPTYGRISRSGILSYANSLDKLGIMAKKIDDVAQVLNVASGNDENDSTSIEEASLDIDLSNENKSKKTNFKIGIIKESMNESVNSEIQNSFKNTIEKLKENGSTVEEVSLPITFEYGIPTYYILAMSECSTNLSALCGLRYGEQELKSDEHFSDYFKKIRSNNFGVEAKRRIMLGTFTRMAGYRDAFYIKAAKVRTKVIEEYKELFEKFDILLSPTMPIVAPKFDEIKNLKPIDHYLSDIMTVGPNLAGIPHMSYPLSKTKEGMPFGIMVSADQMREDLVLEFGKHLENINSN